MMAFRTSTDAVDFALAFLMDTGVDHIGIRVGINCKISKLLLRTFSSTNLRYKR